MRRGLSNHAGTASEQWLAAVRLLCSSHVGTPSRRSAHKREWGLRFLDVGSMVLQLPPKLNFLPARTPVYGTLDGRHLHAWLNIEVLNLILNAADEARRAAAAVLLQPPADAISANGAGERGGTATARGGHGAARRRDRGTAGAL